ncbi:Uncharacterized conserved protein YbbC, DUF1343 family [Bowdeniella nasicola]|uniref:Uncharacterized conserved protein YbbC, DUF1343 family n=1 Tax=Bowdeniella nasicola TaxID=208480 RepID=A0A1H4AC52_9ACTO|nr:DUF1343 domain-containing protein [Bowdeniella nasicola]SEA33271.1 Uncharacterized conserved protein YbbC, DUF1343 family [Bowdeniella nasicola]
MTVCLGIDRLLADPSLIPGSRWGLITNFTGVTADLTLSSKALVGAGAPLVALLAPEHGLRGTAQAGESEPGGIDSETGLQVLDTYRLAGAELDRAISELNLDALICDLQDIGARYYTYAWTMLDCLRSAARLGIPFYVLDRPNPLGGEIVSGPGVATGFESFIGRIDIPIRHGLTMGEIARVGARLDRERGEDVPDPHVIEMTGWQRAMTWQDTGLFWVPPSPNIPSPLSAFAFVGNGLVEGTELSEGRGTTRPFEFIGAPWLTPDFAAVLNARGLPGVIFRPTFFQPTFSKHAGTPVCGVHMHITDTGAYDPLATGIELLAAAQAAPASQFTWRTPAWEQDEPRPHFIDLIWGSPALREALDSGEAHAARAQLADAQALRARDEDLLLYSSQ